MPFTGFCKQIGMPVDKILTHSKFPRKALELPESLVPMSACTSFLSKAKQMEGLPNYGLLVGQQTQVAQLGGFGRLVQSSLTVYEALENIQNHLASHGSAATTWFERKDKLVWFCHRYFFDFGEGGHQSSLFTLMLLLNLIRLATGPRWRPVAIQIQMPYSKEVSAFSEFAGINVLFGQAQSAIALQLSTLALPLPNRFNLDPVQAGMDLALLVKTAPAFDLPGSVRQLIQTQLLTGTPSMTRLAESIHISNRTLQRRLEEEGLSYSRLVEEVRFEKATALLADPAVKVREIAHVLGYRDPANFTRAFRSWTGISPAEYRKLRLEEEWTGAVKV